MTADLSGSDALRCRAEAEGALLALGGLNARGGLPGGRKLALDVQDDGGSGARAAALVGSARAHGAVALLDPCGAGAASAVRAARGLPAIVADPAVPQVTGQRVWRSAPDPYVEGLAIGQYVRDQPRSGGQPRPRAVAAIAAPSPGYPHAATALRIEGLRAVMRAAAIRLTVLPASTLDHPAALRRAIAPNRWMATLLDGDPRRIGSALGALGRRATNATLYPDQIVAASPLLDERFQLAAGVFGKTGSIASPSEVVPDSRDAQLYVAQQRAFFRGDRPSLAGLRGYVAGLTLREGLRDGTDPDSIAARLRRPQRFTDALLAPWRSDAPTAGGPLVNMLAPRFLTSNLLPPGQGGEAHSGTFFDAGAWVVTSAQPLGLTRLIR
jgi:hypothetical protein